MNTYLKSAGVATLGFAALATAIQSSAATFTIDPAAPWQAFMNVSELPSNGGAYVFGSGWGVADASASFAGNVLTLGAAPIGTSDSFWYVGGVGEPGAVGNKSMDAVVFFQDDSLTGQSVTFEGTVLSNSFVAGRTVFAFIRDFAPDYSSFEASTVALTPGDFSITLNTIADPARHVQIGFNMVGANVWTTDVAAAGFATVTALAAPIPEPSSFALIGALVAGAVAMGGRRRR